MSASRLLLFGISLFRAHKPTFFHLPSKHFPSASLRFRRCSSSAAVDALSGHGGGDEAVPVQFLPDHPWPEWVSFVDRLKTKGYFTEESSAENDGPESVYRDMKLVKEACLSFGRDRYDVLKSLSLEDIQKVVDRGCPNLFRKAVNSSKRLRAHVRLDERDVCSACDLRGSCDRAYMILKDSEAAARTVDIVRILLLYALDPLVISGCEKPPGRELLDASARKLLRELVELSEKSPDPALPIPAVEASSPKKERGLSLKNDELSQDVEMKIGDWVCPKCNFVNFARNKKCLECNEVPNRSSLEIVKKKGDWACPECNFMNFSRNKLCLKCKTEGPKKISIDEVEMKKGDWNCPGCGFMNFSSNVKCLRCKERRPKRLLNPGEWECSSCNFLNYRKNMVCKRCSRERPKEATTEYEEHTWRRPS